MSTSQITNSGGQIQYAPDYIEISDNLTQCERCLELKETLTSVFFFSKIQRAKGMQKIAAVVCQECWERSYEFYEDEFEIVDSQQTTINREYLIKRLISANQKRQKFRIGEIVSYRYFKSRKDRRYHKNEISGQGEIIKITKNNVIIYNLENKIIDISKHHITKI